MFYVAVGVVLFSSCLFASFACLLLSQRFSTNCTPPLASNIVVTISKYTYHSFTFLSAIAVEVVTKNPGSIGVRIEGSHTAGAVDGTHNNLHLKLEDHDLLHLHQRQQQQTIDKKRSV